MIKRQPMEGVRRPLAYLAGALPVKVGDRVRVPIGENNTVRCGQVLSVGTYTRSHAPWPPEKTKSVVEIWNEDPAPRA